ncbi:invasion associated locus B family protein [Profundibacterium mesophilum]|uniref:Invasion associated locus B protein domain containing protein n=1 Tax=Profundibacterium mesophilum KAUST100406-0324 TaxID=1037889 RepID=A0A921NNB4_9RHOB|nr:invasion associated locus B family protein [Profundibacterium mesophilum]KAF0674736.1 Invasion associated locus B protein domain containing protein [Profundibacterium mesophilum KAUST100406-0324]
MTPTLKTISITALLAGAAPLWAQTDTPATDSETSAQTEQQGQDAQGTQDAAPTGIEAAVPGEDGPDAPATQPAGEAAPATNDAVEGGAQGASSELPAQEGNGDAVGETYISESHGDWNVRCVRTAEGSDPCQLYQLLKDERGNSVAEISLFGLPQNDQVEAGATIITPLETLLTEQLSLSVDGGKQNSYPFTFCAANGCYARVGFTASEVNQFKRGNSALMRIVPAAAPDQMIDLTISLSGFTAGYEAVNAANAGN